MCWSNYMATPIVLKKPLKVNKVGTVLTFSGFISLFQGYVYHKCQAMPKIEINPEFDRLHPTERLLNPVWRYSRFHIYKGYHSYLTKETAKYRSNENNIGVFEISAGATIYVNYRSGEVVSTNIKYLGLLKE